MTRACSKVFVEKTSGAQRGRPQLQAALGPARQPVRPAEAP
jgi:hypothetical protein